YGSKVTGCTAALVIANTPVPEGRPRRRPGCSTVRETHSWTCVWTVPLTLVRDNAFVPERGLDRRLSWSTKAGQESGPVSGMWSKSYGTVPRMAGVDGEVAAEPARAGQLLRRNFAETVLASV